MHRPIRLPLLLLTIASFALCSASYSQEQKHEDKKEKKEEKKEAKKNAEGLPTIIWHDPGDLAALDLMNGAGGKDHTPADGPFTFIEEDMNGTSPKFDVKDGVGVKWRVKLGAEPQSETAATRLLWAAGYFSDEDYYFPEIKVNDMPPKLKRGQEFVSEGGVVRGARLERKAKDIKKVGTWSWFKNPFVGTKEFNGLRVMMALINNWDLKEINNSIYVVGGEQRYVVTDVGASFGKTGSPLGRSKSDPNGYEKSGFIQKLRANDVDLELHSRPPLFAAVNLPNYRARSKMEDITKHIPRADAHWLGELLGHLSKDQLRDCFRSGGYSPEDSEGYATELQGRIEDLKAL
jgi:hypothetical protein